MGFIGNGAAGADTGLRCVGDGTTWAAAGGVGAGAGCLGWSGLVAGIDIAPMLPPSRSRSQAVLM
jgi:hypothetical protein